MINTRKGKKYGHKNVSTLLSHLTMDTFLLLLFIVIVIKHKKSTSRTFSQNFLYCDTCLPDTKDLANKVICVFCKYLLIFGFDFLEDLLHRSRLPLCNRKSLQIFNWISFFFNFFPIFNRNLYRQLSHVQSVVRVSV